MVALNSVRAHNANLKSLPAGLVAVFVGGTSGIGWYDVLNPYMLHFLS